MNNKRSFVGMSITLATVIGIGIRAGLSFLFSKFFQRLWNKWYHKGKNIEENQK